MIQSKKHHYWNFYEILEQFYKKYKNLKFQDVKNLKFTKKGMPCGQVLNPHIKIQLKIVGPAVDYRSPHGRQTGGGGLGKMWKLQKCAWKRIKKEKNKTKTFNKKK